MISCLYTKVIREQREKKPYMNLNFYMISVVLKNKAFTWLENSNSTEMKKNWRWTFLSLHLQSFPKGNYCYYIFVSPPIPQIIWAHIKKLINICLSIQIIAFIYAKRIIPYTLFCTLILGDISTLSQIDMTILYWYL